MLSMLLFVVVVCAFQNFLHFSCAHFRLFKTAACVSTIYFCVVYFFSSPCRVLITHTWNWPCILWFSFHLSLLVSHSHCLLHPSTTRNTFQRHFLLHLSLPHTYKSLHGVNESQSKYTKRQQRETLILWEKKRCGEPFLFVVHGERAPATQAWRKAGCFVFTLTDSVLLHALSLWSHCINSGLYEVCCVFCCFHFFLCLPPIRDRFTFFSWCVPSISCAYPQTQNQQISIAKLNYFFLFH